jgi:hypothetical protein
MLVVVAGDLVFQRGENSTQPRARLSPFIAGQHDLPRTGTGSCPAPQWRSDALARSASVGGLRTFPVLEVRRTLGAPLAGPPPMNRTRPLIGLNTEFLDEARVLFRIMLSNAS